MKDNDKSGALDVQEFIGVYADIQKGAWEEDEQGIVTDSLLTKSASANRAFNDVESRGEGLTAGDDTAEAHRGSGEERLAGEENGVLFEIRKRISLFGESLALL